MKRGSVAQSLKGHDKGKIYIVTQIIDDYATLCDGKNKTLEFPKKKKLKHIAETGDWADLSVYNPLYDAHIKKILKAYNKKGGCYLG